MQRRDLVIGAGVLLIIVAIVLFIQNRQEGIESPLDTSPTPSAEERQRSIEDMFNIDIPDDVEKATLDGTRGSGIATRDTVGTTSNITVLVDLPDPAEGKFYQAWLRSGAETRFLGNLSMAKGGYLIDANVSGTGAEYDEVVVSLESVDDREIEEVILRGNF